MMRMESNHSRGTFRQLLPVLHHGLTCRLYSLHYRIEAIKSRVEVRHGCITVPAHRVIDNGASVGG